MLVRALTSRRLNTVGLLLRHRLIGVSSSTLLLLLLLERTRPTTRDTGGRLVSWGA
jgi:hypothetical protein